MLRFLISQLVDADQHTRYIPDVTPYRAGMRARGAVAVLFVLGSCRGCRDGDEAAEVVVVETPAVDVGAAAAQEVDAGFVPTKTTRIGYEDTVPIETIEAQPQEREWVDKDPGEPRVLLTGKHLELADRWPAGKNRGFVEVLDGEGPSAKVVSTHLVDFERGSILEIEEVWTPSARKFGLARARAKVDGALRDVVVHTEDGHVVPWDDGPLKDAEFLMHPGTGQVWLFVNDGSEAKTKYSHWANLRESPPAPTHELPLHFELPTEENHNEIEVPTYFNPSPVPILLIPGDAPFDCPWIELRSDGTAPCITDDSTPLADGWRIMPSLGGGAIVNTETGELVILEGSEDCSLTSDVTESPPRATFKCNGDGDTYLWSPSRTVRIPRRENWAMGQASADRCAAWVEIKPTQNEPPIALEVTDFERQRRLKVPPSRPVFYSQFSQLFPLRPDPAPLQLWMLSLPTSELAVVPADGCTRLEAIALAEHVLAYHCLNRGGQASSTLVADANGASVWKMPALEQVWLQTSPLGIIGVRRVGSKRQLLSWTLN